MKQNETIIFLFHFTIFAKNIFLRRRWSSVIRAANIDKMPKE